MSLFLLPVSGVEQVGLRDYEMFMSFTEFERTNLCLHGSTDLKCRNRRILFVCRQWDFKSNRKPFLRHPLNYTHLNEWRTLTVPFLGCIRNFIHLTFCPLI